MTESINSRLRLKEIIIYTFIWLFVAILPVIIGVWESINGEIFRWRPIYRWWIGMIPLIVLFLVNNFILMPYLLRKGRILLYLLAVGVLMVCFGAYKHDTARNHVKPRMELRPPVEFDLRKNPHERPPFPPHPMRLPLPELFMLALGMLTVGINVAVSISFDEHRNRLHSKELENFKLQEELKYLKHQISPHFFMNVLNNIHEMAEEDTKKAQEMIIELSQLMRHALYEDTATSFSSEVTFISSYISLMKLRYPDDMVMVMSDLPDRPSDDKMVPTLLFISFIENAFKHGVTFSRPTSIDIRLREAEDHLYFSCCNTVPPVNGTEKPGGVGIANVRRRLDLLYGKDYSLSIDKDEDRFEVTLIIPWCV